MTETAPFNPGPALKRWPGSRRCRLRIVRRRTTQERTFAPEPAATLARWRHPRANWTQMENQYYGERLSVLERELTNLRAAETAHAAYVASLTTIRAAAQYRQTRERIDAALDDLASIREDTITGPIYLVELAIEEIEGAQDFAAARSARPVTV